MMACKRSQCLGSCRYVMAAFEPLLTFRFACDSREQTQQGTNQSTYGPFGLACVPCGYERYSPRRLDRT
jgi:hypothetical protein